MDVGVYLPQVGFTWDELRARVLACDELGIHSVWFMDHLYPPTLPQVPSFEAWTTAAALAARDRARPPRASRPVQRLPPSGGPREDGDHARPRERRAFRARHRQRLLRAGVRRVRPPVPARRGTRRALGETLEVVTRLFAEDRAVVRRRRLPAARRAQPAAAGAAPASADPRRRRRRAADAAARGALCRRLELPDLRARRAGAEDRRAARPLPRDRPRSGDPARHRGGRPGAGRAARPGRRSARVGRAPLRRPRLGVRSRAATAARPTTSSRACANARSSAWTASCSSSTTASSRRRYACWRAR